MIDLTGQGVPLRLFQYFVADGVQMTIGSHEGKPFVLKVSWEQFRYLVSEYSKLDEYWKHADAIRELNAKAAALGFTLEPLPKSCKKCGTRSDG